MRILEYYFEKDYVNTIEILYYIMCTFKCFEIYDIDVENTICRTMRFFTSDINNNFEKLRNSFVMNNEKFRKTIVDTLKNFNRDDLIFNLSRRFKL